MYNSNLQASTQYGDFKGTSSADRSDHHQLSQLAKDKGIDMEKYFIIGASLYVGENHLNPPVSFRADLMLVNKGEVGKSIPDIQRYVTSKGGTLPYYEIRLEITLEDFLMHFKRFSVVFANKNLGNVTNFEIQELDVELED